MFDATRPAPQAPPPGGPAPATEVRDLRVGRGGHTVLADVTCAFPEPVTCLFGPNGSGKSTLLAALATLLPPTSGTVTVAGCTVADRRSALEARGRLGYLPQRPEFPTHFTVEEALAYAAWLHRIPRRRRPAAVTGVVDALDLGEHRRARLRTLSGGTLQRVHLGLALIHAPRVLLLDEPTVGLDADRRVEFRRLLRTLSAGRVVILSTHLTEDIELLADHVVGLRTGSVVFTGTPEELVAAGRAHQADMRPVEAALRAFGDTE